MYKMRPVGPNSALCLLSLWLNKQHELTQSEFEELFDSILEFLERLNNEQYRLWPDANLPDTTDGEESPQ